MRCLILLLTAFLSSAAFAEPTIEDFGALPEIRNMAISPNGELVAYRNVTSNEDAIRVVSLRENKVVAAIDVSSVKPRDVFLLTMIRSFYGFPEQSVLRDAQVVSM